MALFSSYSGLKNGQVKGLARRVRKILDDDDDGEALFYSIENQLVPMRLAAFLIEGAESGAGKGQSTILAGIHAARHW